MAGKIVDSAKNMLNSIGAVQTLVENFPMSLIAFNGTNIASSFDVLTLLFKCLGVNRDEMIELVTNSLTGGLKNGEDGRGFIAQAEEIVKMALETNLTNIINCSTNPIISNNLMDNYNFLDNPVGGAGINLSVSEIDFTGVLQNSPLSDKGSKFYFDLEDENGEKYNVNNLYKSKDFNVFLWYIINRSTEGVVWDNRYRAALYGKGNGKTKEIIKCSYIDEAFPQSDIINVQICSSEYYKTRGLVKNSGSEWKLNKTIFEFNHDFLSSIKLYDPKVIVAEIVEYLLGKGNTMINLGLSVNEQIIESKVQQIIKNIIDTDDTVINDCYFSFSNDEYNEMLEKSEKSRYGTIYTDEEEIEIDRDVLLERLNGINSNSKLIDDKTIIENTLQDLIVSPAQDGSTTISYNLSYDWQFELMRMLVYPFVRPLFTPKVIFLLLVNKQIMGSLEDIDRIDMSMLAENLISTLLNIIKDIVVKIKDLLVDMFLNFALEKLKPLLALFASRLLLETLQSYKDLLTQCYKACAIGWNGSGSIIGAIDDVNYADIIPEQIMPEQNIC